jgi:dephospho-CoA kinase
VYINNFGNNAGTKEEVMALQHVIGLVGQKVAGKGTISRRLSERYGFSVLVTGQVIRDELFPLLGREPLTTDLMDYANKMKFEKGAGYWMDVLLKRARACEFSNMVIDGIRHPDELEVLSKELGGKFLPLGITATFERRLEWYFKRQKVGDKMDREWFVRMDARDQGFDEPPWGQQVAATLGRLAPAFVYDNAAGLDELHKWVDRIVSDIIDNRR